MIIPPNYTPVQITVPDDKNCHTIYYMWNNIYRTNRDTYSYISHLSLARTYNLIYSLIKTDKLKILKYLYTTIPLISAENIEFYKLNNTYELITKEENNIKEIITFEGKQIWFKDGEYHRDNDLPALIHHNGKQEWFKNGSRHRDNDLPAIIYDDGTQSWYQNGLCHRDNDLPALTCKEGIQYWYKDGNFHRDNDLPAVIYPDGTQVWYKDGLRHRDNDLPAVVRKDGSQQWYKHGVKYDYPS